MCIALKVLSAYNTHNHLLLDRYMVRCDLISFHINLHTEYLEKNWEITQTGLSSEAVALFTYTTQSLFQIIKWHKSLGSFQRADLVETEFECQMWKMLQYLMGLKTDVFKLQEKVLKSVEMKRKLLRVDAWNVTFTCKNDSETLPA